MGKQAELSALGVLVLSDFGVLFSAFLFCFNNLNIWRNLLHSAFFLEKEICAENTDRRRSDLGKSFSVDL